MKRFTSEECAHRAFGEALEAGFVTKVQVRNVPTIDVYVFSLPTVVSLIINFIELKSPHEG